MDPEQPHEILKPMSGEDGPRRLLRFTQQISELHTFARVFVSRFGLLLFCLIVGNAVAEEAASTNEFWPEASVFITAHPNVRVILTTKRERDAEFRNSEVGGTIEWSLHRFRPVIHGPWVDQDATRKTLITAESGYKYKLSFDETPPVHENRPDVAVTLRWVFPEDILVSNRACWEFRFVSGSPFSWRYRDRVEIEKDFKIRRYTFTCYIAAEPFFNSKTGTWDRFRFMGGTVLPLGRRFAIEPYYLRQIVTDGQPRYTNALGLAAKVHIRN